MERSRRKLFVSLIVIFCVIAAGAVIAFIISIVSNIDSNPADVKSFHSILDQNADNISDLITYIDSIYNAEVPVQQFNLSSDDYESQVKLLNNGIDSLMTLDARVQNGAPIRGTSEQIDITSNYNGLKEALPKYLPVYKNSMELTLQIMSVFQAEDQSSATLLASYEAAELAEAIEIYLSNLEDINTRLTENHCIEVESAVCDALYTEYADLESDMTSASIVQDTYIRLFGELPNYEDGSVMYYINNLYVATEGSNEED